MVTQESIGVCSWSIDRHDQQAAIFAAGRELRLKLIHLGFFSTADAERADGQTIAGWAQEAGVTVPGTFVGFEGEDYSSISTIAETGGLTPDEVYPDRLTAVRRVAEITAALDARFVALHVGTIPSDSAEPLWTRLVSRTREAADLLGEKLHLLLETGRESAETLAAFVRAVDRPNVAVNYDPANFIVYGTDEPARAVSALRGLIANVHVKDALKSARPGVEYGQRAPIGSGDAQIPRILSKLRATHYDGPLMIEVGGPSPRTEAIKEAAHYLRSMLG